jgi:hypothetical protein
MYVYTNKSIKKLQCITSVTLLTEKLFSGYLASRALRSWKVLFASNLSSWLLLFYLVCFL